MYIYATLCIGAYTALVSCTHSRPHTFLQRRRARPARECRMWELAFRHDPLTVASDWLYSFRTVPDKPLIWLASHFIGVFLMGIPRHDLKLGKIIHPAPQHVCLTSKLHSVQSWFWFAQFWCNHWHASTDALFWYSEQNSSIQSWYFLFNSLGPSDAYVRQ